MPTQRKEKGYYSYVDEWKTMWKPDLDALGGYNGQSCDPTRVDLKVIQWVKDNCAGMPHFVKVINSKAARGRSTKSEHCSVSVPIPFVNQYYMELDRVVSLENDEGRTWRVSFGSPRKQPIWYQGWNRVVRDNSLKSGDVVVFVLLQKSCFRFTLFNADGSIRKKSTTESVNVDSTLICKEEFPRCSARSPHQDQAFVNNLETQHIRKTRKWKFTVPTDCRHTNQEAGYEERDGSAPDNSHGHADPNQFPVPTKKQITEPPCKERKLQKTKKDVEAVCQTLNLPVEEVIKSRGENSSNTIVDVISTKNSPKCEIDPYDPQQSSSLPTAPRDISPRFESFDPFDFTFKSRRRMITALERQRAGNLAMAHAKDLTEHHFVYVMLETHVYRDFHLVLPDYFAMAASLPASPIQLKFLDCAGYSWDMYSKKNTYDQFALHHKYWALFALHHLLEEGDVCVFALKEKELACTVLVHIFRVVPVSPTNSTSVHSHYETHEIDGTPNNSHIPGT